MGAFFVGFLQYASWRNDFAGIAKWPKNDAAGKDTRTNDDDLIKINDASDENDHPIQQGVVVVPLLLKWPRGSKTVYVIKGF